jgi:excisionase family DNA binding protein
VRRFLREIWRRLTCKPVYHVALRSDVASIEEGIEPGDNSWAQYGRGFYTQVAAMLHVSVATVREAIEAGQLRATKVSGDYQISPESMREFLRTGNPFAQ